MKLLLNKQKEKKETGILPIARECLPCSIHVFQRQFSIGFNYLGKIFSILGHNPNLRLCSIKAATIEYNKQQQIAKIIKLKLTVYRKTWQDHKDFLTRMRFYKGIRYSLRLPVRGQRTHTNSKTARKLLKKW